MSVASRIWRGYGFGTNISYLPTRGYDAAPVVSLFVGLNPYIMGLSTTVFVPVASNPGPGLNLILSLNAGTAYGIPMEEVDDTTLTEDTATTPTYTEEDA